MPQPLSETRISFLPPPSIWTLMRVAPASSEFSSNSLSTEAGRSTTSPAAILLATCSESTWIRPMRRIIVTRSRGKTYYRGTQPKTKTHHGGTETLRKPNHNLTAEAADGAEEGRREFDE